MSLKRKFKSYPCEIIRKKQSYVLTWRPTTKISTKPAISKNTTIESNREVPLSEYRLHGEPRGRESKKIHAFGGLGDRFCFAVDNVSPADVDKTRYIYSRQTHTRTRQYA